MTNNVSNRNLSNELFLVTREQKEALNQQKAFVIWLTGLSGSGKSTIARNLELSLFQSGILTLVLDGDNTRRSINCDLDFSATGRKENIRRVAEIAKLLNDAGVVVITAFISPFLEDRSMAKSIIGEAYFIEVFVDAGLELCIERDTKGLYQKAINGELKDFTGINSPYETPDNPNVILNTRNQKPQESIQSIHSWLCSKNYINL
jgi:adenylyl-sulfate kinase